MQRRWPPDYRYDVIVVGGGILGAFVALGAARRGYRCLLLERNDFGGGTTAGCGKVLHGGIRHLRSVELRAAMVSRTEQRRMAGLAPGLVRPIPFVFPLGTGFVGRALARAGSVAWDGFRQVHPATDDLGPTGATLLQGPDSLADRWGMEFWDLQIRSPERLTLALLLEANGEGADLANYVRALDVAPAGRDAVVTVRDERTETTGEVRARVVVNATGAWAATLAGAVPVLPPTAFARGVHIVMDGPEPDRALALPWTRGRHLFVMPWEGRTLLGASYTTGEPSDHRPLAGAGEVQTLLDDVARRYPELEMHREAVIHAYAGYYPIFGRSRIDENRYDVSMKPLVVERDLHGGSAVVTAVAVKLTTARRLAADVVRRVDRRMDRRDDRAIQFVQGPLKAAAEPWRDPEPEPASLRSFGARAARDEMAIRLEDCLLRRTTLLQRTRLDPGSIAAAAEGMASVLGWDPVQVRQEVQSIRPWDAFPAPSEGRSRRTDDPLDRRDP